MFISSPEIGMSVTDSPRGYRYPDSLHETFFWLHRIARVWPGEKIIKFGIDPDISHPCIEPNGIFWALRHDLILFDPDSALHPNGLLLRKPLIPVLMDLENEGAEFWQITMFDNLGADVSGFKQNKNNFRQFKSTAARDLYNLTGIQPEDMFRVEGRLSLDRILAGQTRPVGPLEVGRFDKLVGGFYRCGMIQKAA